jgi:hypothetical protein
LVGWLAGWWVGGLAGWLELGDLKFAGKQGNRTYNRKGFSKLAIKNLRGLQRKHCHKGPRVLLRPAIAKLSVFDNGGEFAKGDLAFFWRASKEKLEQELKNDSKQDDAYLRKIGPRRSGRIDGHRSFKDLKDLKDLNKISVEDNTRIIGNRMICSWKGGEDGNDGWHRDSRTRTEVT